MITGSYKWSTCTGGDSMLTRVFIVNRNRTFFFAHLNLQNFQFIKNSFVDEPCLEENHQSLDNWERSVNNTEIGNLCDNTLTPGWYRPISAVGNAMPTECPQGGYKCGTSSPIWMDGRNLSHSIEINRLFGHIPTQYIF